MAGIRYALGRGTSTNGRHTFKLGVGHPPLRFHEEAFIEDFVMIQEEERARSVFTQTDNGEL